MKKFLFAGAYILLVTLATSAQTATIENVRKAHRSNFGVIKERTDVKGYYFFYVSDQIDKKTNEYTLRIMDNTLKMLKDIKFQDSKDVLILESSFNGTDLIFLFYNQDAKTFEYQVYGAVGKKKFV